MRFRPPTTWIAIVAALAAFALLPAAAAQAQTGRFVALGDSDPAASGLPPIDGAAPPNCFRTVNGHPRLAAQELGAAEYVDATCAAATTADLTATQYVFGQPANPPQLGTLNGSERIVTLTIGDNDADVSNVSTHCLNASDQYATPCHDHYGDNGLQNLTAGIGAATAQALDEIHARAPGATIFLVGYPRMLPPDVSSCWGRINVTAADAPLVTGWQQAINDAQRNAAASHGAVFIDLFSDWAPGRDGCADPSAAWVRPNINPPGGWPLHPTLLGQQHAAQRVVAAVKAAGLWAPATPVTLPAAAEATALLQFKRLRPARGARKQATLRRPRRGGGSLRISANTAGSVRLRLAHKRVGVVVDGRCRVGRHGGDGARARRCSVYRPWGKPVVLKLKRGSTTIWLTASSRSRTAARGIYRLRYTFGGRTRTSRQFRVASTRTGR